MEVVVRAAATVFGDDGLSLWKKGDGCGDDADDGNWEDDDDGGGGGGGGDRLVVMAHLNDDDT